jgi:hypothetical protein
MPIPSTIKKAFFVPNASEMEGELSIKVELWAFGLD